MDKKRLLILVTIVVLCLGSLGVVQVLTAGKQLEESGSGNVQSLTEPPEGIQNPAEPSEDIQNPAELSEDMQEQTGDSEDKQEPPETSESILGEGRVSRGIWGPARILDDLRDRHVETFGTYFDLDFDELAEIDENTFKQGLEADWQYKSAVEISELEPYWQDRPSVAEFVDPNPFSESVNNIVCADPDCHTVLVGVLAQYADDHGEAHSVFEMESYYKSMWIEDGLWGHKVLDTATDKTLYIAYSDARPEGCCIALIGYIYKVE